MFRIDSRKMLGLLQMQQLWKASHKENIKENKAQTLDLNLEVEQAMYKQLWRRSRRVLEHLMMNIVKTVAQQRSEKDHQIKNDHTKSSWRAWRSSSGLKWHQSDETFLGAQHLKQDPPFSPKSCFCSSFAAFSFEHWSQGWSNISWWSIAQKVKTLRIFSFSNLQVNSDLWIMSQTGSHKVPGKKTSLFPFSSKYLKYLKAIINLWHPWYALITKTSIASSLRNFYSRRSFRSVAKRNTDTNTNTDTSVDKDKK